MEYEIERNLVASTCHITKEDNEWLGNDLHQSYLSVYVYYYGFYIHVNQEPDELEEVIRSLKGKVSSALCNLLRLAHAQRCSYLKLDCDGPEYDLPKYEW